MNIPKENEACNFFVYTHHVSLWCFFLNAKLHRVPWTIYCCSNDHDYKRNAEAWRCPGVWLWRKTGVSITPPTARVCRYTCDLCTGNDHRWPCTVIYFLATIHCARMAPRVVVYVVFIQSCTSMWCSYTAVRLCGVHTQLYVHVVFIQSCTSMSRTSRAIHLCGVHPKLYVYVVFIHSCTSMWCSPRAVRLCGVNTQLYIYVVFIHSYTSVWCSSRAVRLCSVHPELYNYRWFSFL